MTRTKYLVEDSRVVRVFSDTLAQCCLVLQLAIILSPLDLFNQVIVTSHTSLPFSTFNRCQSSTLYAFFNHPNNYEVGSIIIFICREGN